MNEVRFIFILFTTAIVSVTNVNAFVRHTNTTYWTSFLLPKVYSLEGSEGAKWFYIGLGGTRKTSCIVVEVQWPFINLESCSCRGGGEWVVRPEVKYSLQSLVIVLSIRCIEVPPSGRILYTCAGHSVYGHLISHPTPN